MSQNSIMAFEWDDAWCLGIEEIDNDHKKLVQLIHVLFEAMKIEQPAPYIQEIFVSMVDYTKYHFQRKEDWMESHNFPGLEEHKISHQKLIAQVLDISTEVVLNTDPKLLGGDIYEYLKQWLIYHILNEDMKLKSVM